MQRLVVLLVVSFIGWGCQPVTRVVDNGEPGPAEDSSFSVLFVGNSLTYYNDLPGMFRQLGRDNSSDLHVESYTRAGTPLRKLVYQQALKTLVQSRQWDVLVLQSDDIAAFPDMYNIEVRTLEQVKSWLPAQNASTTLVYQMAWGVKNGPRIRELDGQVVHYPFETYVQKIGEGVDYLSETVGCEIAPVGWAWLAAITEDDVWQDRLFADDGAHPALAGSYLNACVIYSTLFHCSVVGNAYRAGLPADEAHFLQGIASTTVLNGEDQ